MDQILHNYLPLINILQNIQNNYLYNP